MTARFDWIIEPCDRYLIWDQMEGLPASCGNDMLVFDTVEEADRIATQLNEHGRAMSYLASVGLEEGR
jgi:hypothetical protein